MTTIGFSLSVIDDLAKFDIRPIHVYRIKNNCTAKSPCVSLRLVISGALRGRLQNDAAHAGKAEDRDWQTQ